MSPIFCASEFWSYFARENMQKNRRRKSRENKSREDNLEIFIKENGYKMCFSFLPI